MNHTFESGTLTIFFIGHIDSANAGQVEKEVFDLVKQYAPTQVIIDADKLEYISSSGLRIILKLRQRFAGIKLINASSDVYEILEMTGFTDMMTVEKAYKIYDISGCQMIGKGANGKVYRYNREIIVKVYNENADLEDIKRERELSRTAFVLGIPTAIPYGVVKVGNCYGTVFELLNAKSFDELMIEDPANLDFVVDKSVEVAKILHTTDAPKNLPSQKQIALEWVLQVKGILDDDDYSKLYSLIRDLPDKRTMLHGDFHVKNIMQQGDDTLLIDLDTLSFGHPLYEFAFIFNAYIGFGVVDPNVVENFLGFPAELARKLWRNTLMRYFETDDPEVLNTLEKKAAIIGYLRLMRRDITKGRQHTPMGRAMINACKDKLHELLPLFDSLDF